MTRLFFVFAAMLTLGLQACGSGESGPTDQEPAAPARAAAPAATASAASAEKAQQEALQIFGTRCFTCHGPEGAGDGPGSEGLTPKPRNFQDSEWQATVSDEHLEKIILYGGAAVGKSPGMPGNPDLGSRNEVVAALIEHIRSLSRP